MADESALPVAPQTQRELLAEFERQRQLRLAQSSAPLLAMLAGIFAVCIIVVAHFYAGLDQDAALSSAVLVALSGTACAVAAYYARQGRGRLAADIIATAVGAGVVSVAFAWGTLVGLDSFELIALSLFALVIILTGLLIGQRAAFITTLASNLLTILLIVMGLGHHNGDAQIGHDAPLYTALLILTQWAFAGLMFGVSQNYFKTFQELSRLYLEVRQVDEIKDQFITTVNHELRNPVMAMSGYIEVLRLRQNQMSDDRRAEILEQAGRVGDRVSSLLESILDARRLDEGADDFTPAVVNVRRTVEAAAQLLDPREGSLAEGVLRIEVPDDLAIWGDEVRLQQIFTNLISNAVKYSPAGSPIIVSSQIVTEALPATRPLSRAPKIERAMAQITVRDYGHGIPPEQAPLLFRRFVRLPRDLASTTIGNGLGLHLCKVFVEAMRGRIWLESSGIEGEGTAFHFTLPLPPAEYMMANGLRQGQEHPV